MKTKEILLDIRNKNKLTQEQMAKRLFVTRQAVSRWENGETMPNIDTLKIISTVFKVPIGNLLGLEGKRVFWFKTAKYCCKNQTTPMNMHSPEGL